MFKFYNIYSKKKFRNVSNKNISNTFSKEYNISPKFYQLIFVKIILKFNISLSQLKYDSVHLSIFASTRQLLGERMQGLHKIERSNVT